MNWYLQAMKKYVDFSGRARRKEYWMFTLIYMVIYPVFYIPQLVFLHEGLNLISLAVGIFTLTVALVHLIPGLAVTVRRLHDTGKSGWWFLIILVPIIGGIMLLVFYCTDSESGTNEYGENPKSFSEPMTA